MEQTPLELEARWREVEIGFSRLKRILHGVHGERLSGNEYLHLYTAIYNLCTLQPPPHNYLEKLYRLYETTLEDYTKSIVLPSLKDKCGEFLLREWVDRWKKHKEVVGMLSRFLRLFDSNYLSRKRLTPFRVLGVNFFIDLVFKELKTTLTTTVVDLINDERDGQLIDRVLVKDVLDTYFDLGHGALDLYKHHFEPVFYKGTADFYSEKTATWMLEDSCPEYMFKAEECLRKEEERVVHYLHSSTEPKLLEDVMLQLISRRAEQILSKENSGCRVLLLDEKIEDLSRMYRLFSRMENGVLQVSKIFKEHVNEEGMSLLKHVTDSANSRKNERKGATCLLEEFVWKAIELHDKLLTYVTYCFQNHTAFHKALKEAFELFCNKDIAGCSSAESLAAFCDNILRRGGSEKLSDEAVEETLDKVVNILTYISDKDLFVEFHRKKLGKRLLLYKNVDYDHEQSLLTKLRKYLGRLSTSKMEGMLTEMAIAREHQINFEAYISQNCPESIPRVDLSVTVLTTGCWPSYETCSLNLPSEMIKCVEVFKNYYNKQHKDRKLNWIYSMGSCNIIAKFDTKPIELIVTTYQAALLLLFNEVDRLSYSEIVMQLNLPDDDAVRLLHSLSCVKYKILDKEPSNRTISPSDSFQFNHKFTNKMGRIKVPLPLTDEKEKVIDDVDKDRTLSIEACIVRIMKSHKVMGHEQLLTECIEQLSRMFKPDISIIKRRIEDLIRKEYFEVDQKKANTYRYLE